MFSFLIIYMQHIIMSKETCKQKNEEEREKRREKSGKIQMEEQKTNKQYDGISEKLSGDFTHHRVIDEKGRKREKKEDSACKFQTHDSPRESSVLRDK